MQRIAEKNSNALLVSRVLAGRAFLVKTPVCVLYFAHLKRWLLTGNQGAVVYGWPRLGKTSATRWVLSAIQDVFGTLPFIEVPIRKQHLHNEGAFFQFLLKCCRHRHSRNGTVADKRDRLFEALMNRVRRSATRTVILFIDEAQLLDELEYQWLQNISNELDAAGGRLFCLLVGQHQLSGKRDGLIMDGFEQIVGRFMTEEWSFRGIISQTELERVLAAYDDSFYPKAQNGGKPFLSYFVPVASASGWHLAKLAPSLWDVYVSKWRELEEKGEPEIPMQYVISTIVSLLNTASISDGARLEIGKATIQKAVAECGFYSAMKQFLRARSLEKKKRREI